MLEGVLGTKLWVVDPTSVTIVYCASSINTLLSCASPSKRLFVLSTHNKGVYVIGRIFLVSFVDFSVANNFQDCIRQVRCLFFLRHLNCRYQGGIIFTEVSEEIPLESHLNGLL